MSIREWICCPAGRAFGQNTRVDVEDLPLRTTKGALLVAVPLLEEPTFHRTVVFMLQHTNDGALGLVINRPTEELHVAVIDPWMHELSDPPVLFNGGPVQSNTLIAVAALGITADTDGFAPLAHGLGTVDLSILADELAEGIQHLRVFRGYAGWGPGQLEDELDEGAWLVMPYVIGDVFTPNPLGLWRNVLRRNGGRTALLADAPNELSWN